MSRSKVTARIAVGTSVIACVAVFVAGQLSASSAPPSTDAEASAESIPLSRDDVVLAVIAAGGDFGVAMDRECVVAVVDQIPDDQLGTMMQQLSLSGDVAVSAVAVTVSRVSMPELPMITMPEVSMPDLSKISMPDGSMPELSAISIPDISMPDLSDLTVPDISVPSADAALAAQLISCLQGSSSPDLVDQVVTLISQLDAGLDLDCAAHVLSTIDNDTLQFIVDNAGVLGQDTSVTLPGDTVPEQAFLLTACQNSAVASASGTAEAVAVVTAAPPTTSP